ncbi:MAG TPA: ABC transporter ATP-binding protein [Spirochaetota bacterium]|nr:ABC transporter ATP-binding protein [Spirochaetota bacterium]HOL58063.1 ABC transporter ATP-binding protein [Spirochaetota bacterium]HPP05547.1 ABC transporter ATP-binding protein [Spirochaetota bacterium]
MDNLLEIRSLYKTYSTEAEVLHILNGIDFTLKKGESVSITGESGSGKSTFLNMIGGLDAVTSGNIYFEGVDITQLDEAELTYFRNKKIGFIFQSHYLLEEFTAIENVMIPYLIHSFNKKKAYKKAEELLEFVGLSNRLKHFPSQLSGGEKQRVAIARAFINEPSLILADEPTGNLDERNSEKILHLLFDIVKNKNSSFIIVTHSSHIAELTDKEYRLENGLLYKKR